MQSASCGSAPKNRAEIIDVLLRTLRWGLLDDLVASRPIPESTPLLALLERKGHTAGVPMDEEKDLPQFRVSLLLEACKKDARCEAEARRNLERIQASRESEHVNALAAALLARCLDTAAAEPASRTGLRLPRDRQALEQCAATLASKHPLGR